MPDLPLRAIPSVDQIVRALPVSSLPDVLVTSVVRHVLASYRRQLLTVPEAAAKDFESLLVHCKENVARIKRSRLRPVINATGVVLHTNLARSPISSDAAQAVAAAASHYSNLEFDLETGERGSRGEYLERLLALLSGAEAATLVNNCAAALMLILRTLTTPDKNEVIVSRGELVQIGGGFRIPQILQASGAVLREVGTTNQTTAADYRAAIGPRTAMLLKVHRGNFYMDGFVSSPGTRELSAVATAARVPLVYDAGSGAVSPILALAQDTSEPIPREVLADGADIVCYSGDKLFGGPQAGIIAGATVLIAAMKSEPLFRALRCDKLIFAALQATAEAHLRGAPGDLPIFTLLNLSCESLRHRADEIAAAVRDVCEADVIDSHTAVGGGTLPRARLDSVAIAITHRSLSAATLAARLRKGDPPVIGVIAAGRLTLDVRTIFESQDPLIIAALRAACET